MGFHHFVISPYSVRSLVKQIFKYSRDNLALVNVYIKNPVVTKIRSVSSHHLTPHLQPYYRRDQKIPVIWFVANSGGILGLCMGFSMVTVSTRQIFQNN